MIKSVIKVTSRSLGESSRLFFSGILTIVSNNLNLRYIHLVTCTGLTSRSVIHIAQNLAEKLVSDPTQKLIFSLISYFQGDPGYRRDQISRFRCVRAPGRPLSEYSQVKLLVSETLP